MTGASGAPSLVAVLVDPVGAVRRAVQRPRPWHIAVPWLAAAVALGLAAVPRQLTLLARLMAPTGNPAVDGPQQAVRHAAARLLVADRLTPAPTVLVAALLLVVAAEPVLALARDRRAALWTVALLGLSPVLMWRAAEAALVWLTPAGSIGVPGDVLSLPGRFSSGVGLLLRHHPPPRWASLLDARLNLVTLWCAALWTLGLRELEGTRRVQAWHVLLPLACLAAGALTTWALGPLVIGMLL